MKAKRIPDDGLCPVDPVSGLTRATQPQHPLRRLILCGVLLIAAIAIGTAAMVGSFRERALANSERELENTALLLARHFDQQLEDLEFVEKGLVASVHSAGIVSREDYERQMSSLEMHLLLKTKIGALSYVGGLNLFDSDGKLINSSGAWPVLAVNVADRAYFKEFKSNPHSAEILVDPVFSRITGAWTIVLARKMMGSNGEFLGAVGRGIEPAYFEKFFASLALGEGGAITMFHRDGTLLARHPHIESLIGRNFKAGQLFQNVLSTADHGTTRLHSLLDDQDRLASVRTLDHFPIAIAVTATVSTALAGWREQTRFLIAAAALSALVIAVVLSLIVRQLSQDSKLAGQRLAQEKQWLDIAVNNMTQSLLMYDSSARLVVCNQRYIEMYGLSPNVVKPGCSFRDLIAHRKMTGSFKGDVDEFYSATLRKVAEGKITHSIIESADGRSILVVNHPLENGGWVTTMEDITERKRSDERIEHLAHYDALTDLPNRVLFREQLDRALKAIAPGEQLAVLYIDIDEFKSVNDSLGHSVGDELLKAVADRLRGCLRKTDFIARLGGDEFAVIQTMVEREKDTTDLVARIYRAIRESYECVGHLLTADASIGIALAPEDGTDLDQLLKNADLAMYAAKSDGRRNYRYFEPEMAARVKALRTLELDLRQAIANGGLEIYYQPLVDLHDNKVVGCEALLRWCHPRRGMISPAEFIPVAEDTGLIGQLGEWVLTTACAEAATWPDGIKVAVNVSPLQLKDQTLALKVAAALAASGLAASRLELEITEAVLIRDDEAALGMLLQLRELGVRIVLDDFGTGYSSLSYLQRFPFDKIKIDRCFIQDVAKPGGSACIVQAVVNIATARKMTTAAEGVETQQQLLALRKLGCTEMQGYLFSPAIPAPEIIRLLLSRRKMTLAVA
jgi:diguanylate cyclase (GGDEF)-like protein